MPLSSLLWLFLASVFSGRDGPTHGGKVQGERTAHRPGCFTWTWGGRGMAGKQAYYDFNWACLWVLR